MKNKLWIAYRFVWGDFGRGVESMDVAGVVLVPDQLHAEWMFKLMKVSYDELQSFDSVDNDGTMFKMDA